MKSTVITVRISGELKEELSKYGVRVSEVVRKALEEEVRKRKIEELKAASGKLGEFFAKMSEEEIVRSIRELREVR